MDFKRLSINNFLSIKQADIEFKEGITSIIGNNLDSDRSNGSGKSSIFIAIFWCLYNESPKNITSTEVVRYGEKTCFVEIEFEYNNNIYVVRRSRGERINFTATVNGESITEAEFLKQIPSYQAFCLAMHAQDSVRFLQLSDTEKKEILLSIVNFNPSDILEKMKEDLKKLTIKITELSSKKEYIESELNSLKTTSFPFSEEEKQLILENKSLPSLVQLRLKYMELKASMLEEDSTITNKIIKIQDSLQNLTTQEKLNLTLEKNNRYNKEIEKVMKESFPTMKCPHCNKNFVPREQELLKIRDRKIMDIKSMIVSDEEINTMKEEIKQREDLLKELSLLKKELNLIKSKKEEITNKLSNIASKGTEIKNQIEQFKTINIKIKDKEDQIKNITKEIEEISKRSEVLDDAIKVLSPSGVQSLIIELIIDQINENIEKILSAIFPTISFSLLSQSLLKSGKSSSKIGGNLVVEGQSRGIGSLSGGELRSLYIAVDFAIMMTMEMFLGIKFKTLFLDEPFDGLDVQGRVIALETLASLLNNRKILIIDHASELNSYYNNCIKVTKKEGISYVE